MKRLFYGDLPGADPWKHIFDDDGTMDHQKCLFVLRTYIDPPDVLLYGGSSTSAFHCPLEGAPKYIETMLHEGRGVRAVTPDFKGRALFNPIGVATGCRREESNHS